MNFVSHGAVWYNCHMRNAQEGRAWTADEVGERLVAAFAASLGGAQALQAAGGEVFRSGDGSIVTAAAWLTLVRAKLGRSRETDQLFAWARSRAGYGWSIRHLCRDCGWPRSTFYHRRRRLILALATALAQDGSLSSGANCQLDHLSGTSAAA
jgi:hypothetical protein